MQKVRIEVRGELNLVEVFLSCSFLTLVYGSVTIAAALLNPPSHLYAPPVTYFILGIGLLAVSAFFGLMAELESIREELRRI